METCVWKDRRTVDKVAWISLRDGEQGKTNINAFQMINDGIRDIVHEALKYQWGLGRREVVFDPNPITVVPKFIPEPMVGITRFAEACMIEHKKDL